MVKLRSSKSSLRVRILPTLMIYHFGGGFINLKNLIKSWSPRNNCFALYVYNFYFNVLFFLDVFSNVRKKLLSKKRANLLKKINHAKRVLAMASILDIYSQLLKGRSFFVYDIIILTRISNIYKYFLFDNFRVFFRLNFFKTGFYALYANATYKKNYLNFLSSFLYGWVSFFNFFSKWFLPTALLVSFVYYSLIIKSLPFNKIIFVWCAIFMMLYWIVSGFVFFLKNINLVSLPAPCNVFENVL